MIETYKEFYEFTKGESLNSILQSKDTVFIFDTNVLLELYSIHPESADSIIKILEKIKAQLWMPYQVGFEYQKNRLERIKSRRATLEAQVKDLTSKKNDIETILRSKTIQSNNNIINEINNNKNIINTNINEIIDLINKDLKDSLHVRSQDTIRDKLSTLFTKTRIGKRLTNEELKECIEDANKRYAQNLGPGHKDQGKTETSHYYDYSFENKYGDYLIFWEIKKKAQSFTSEKNIIFVTNDCKEDWWEVYKSDGAKPIGPSLFIKQQLLYAPNTKLKDLVFLRFEDLLSQMSLGGNKDHVLKSQIDQAIEELKANREAHTLEGRPYTKEEGQLIIRKLKNDLFPDHNPHAMMTPRDEVLFLLNDVDTNSRTTIFKSIPEHRINKIFTEASDIECFHLTSGLPTSVKVRVLTNIPEEKQLALLRFIPLEEQDSMLFYMHQIGTPNLDMGILKKHLRNTLHHQEMIELYKEKYENDYIDR